jgi:hypothetical protein
MPPRLAGDSNAMKLVIYRINKHVELPSKINRSQYCAVEMDKLKV